MTLDDLVALLAEHLARISREGLAEGDDRAIKRLSFIAQQLYGAVYLSSPDTHGRDMGFGDVK